jgi:stage III sporulation protein AC
MGVDLIFRVALIGILVSIVNQVLIKSGREEQAMMVTILGIVIVLAMVAKQIVNLFDTVKALFQF